MINILQKNTNSKLVTIGEKNLSLDDIIHVSRCHVPVEITTNQTVLNKVEASYLWLADALKNGSVIYGINTGFGGMSNVLIDQEAMCELQDNIIWYHKTGAGERLPNSDVRAAMLLRMNSHLFGASAIRMEIIQRMQIFLNEGITPHVLDLGSIGASGDLVPLTSIAGALLGHSSAFKVDYRGIEMDSLTALNKLGLPRIQLKEKEGLAMINGTSVMTGIAANCVHDARLLLALSMQSHALAIQALYGTNQSFHPFIHNLKPHSGQIWASQNMLSLIENSKMIRDEIHDRVKVRQEDLIQDRYSLRCLPQFIGPIVDGLKHVAKHVVIEANSANDNPLIDVENDTYFHGGNFLGQYIGTGMDQLRTYIALLAKHLDVQIALAMTPAFNNGLPASLVGNGKRRVNMGLKGLQITGNSIMPLLSFYSNPLAPHFPTHAEQYNQNINSLGFGSANLTRQALNLFREYMGVVLISMCQAVDLRAYKLTGQYDARQCLAPNTIPLYEAINEVVGREPSSKRSFIWNDNEQTLENTIARLTADIATGGKLIEATSESIIPLDE
ncbi:MAG: aromatic amino acid lyase [Anaerolinea sp.]|nr:aromatic amino acid lyase [Anaerolinea sp.]